MLLCDFHIHTSFSDGLLSMTQTVDLFGQAGFDIIAITDHVVNGDTTLGRMTRSMNLSVREETFTEYKSALQAEAARAWSKYGMLVIAGIEISKNYISSDRSAHILVLDVKDFIPACMDYDEIFAEARRQDALIIACHPHHMTDIFPDTLYLWNNREKYAPYIDAWEIANRDDVFNVISLKKYPYIAGSDFHRAQHLYSWKTLLDCDKDTEAVKRCIRENTGVAIKLFREPEGGHQ